MRGRIIPVLVLGLLLLLTPTGGSMPSAEQARTTPQRLGSDQPAARAIVITADPAPTATEEYARRAFDLLGLDVSLVSAGHLTADLMRQEAPGQRVLWFATYQSANRLPAGALAALRRSLEAGADGFVVEISGPMGRLTTLAGNAVHGAVPLPSGTAPVSHFTDAAPEISGALSGIQFAHSAEWAPSYLDVDHAVGVLPIVQTTGGPGGLPRLVAVPRGQGTILLQAGRPGNPALSAPLRTALAGDSRSQRLHVESMLEAVPVLLFARYGAGEAAWHGAERLANLTIDDPPLAQPFWDEPWTARFHSELFTHAQEHNFHITIATVPAHYTLAKPDVIDLYRQHPDRLSLSVHGRDHTCPDFGPGLTEAELLGKVRESQQWMDALTKPSGLHYGKVMTFPCDRFTVRDLAAIQRWNFIAGSNTPDPADLGADVPWDFTASYISPIGGAAYATRQPAEDTVFPLDFALNRPVVLYVHPQYFQQSYGAFDDLADRINAVGKVRWGSLNEVIRRHVWQKRNLDGSYSAQLFTADAIVRNTGDETREYHAWLREHGAPPIDRVLLDGQPVAYDVRDGTVRLSFPVAAGSERSVRVLYQEPKPGEYETAQTIAASQTGPNLVKDPGFEEGLAGWAPWHAQVQIVDGGHTGEKAVRVIWQDPGASDNSRRTLTLSDWPGAVPNPQPGDVYAATVWVRGVGPAIGQPVTLVLREYTKDMAKTDSTYGAAVMLTGDWQELAVKRTARLPAAVNMTVHVELAGAQDGAGFEADDFAMWKVR